MEAKYLSLAIGKIITLSDYQTEIDSGGPADFQVVAVRHYHHEYFTMICCDLENDKAHLMLMVKEVSGETELRVYVLDHEGTKLELMDDGWEHIAADGDSFSKIFSAEVPADEDLTRTEPSENEFMVATYAQKTAGALYDVIAQDMQPETTDKEAVEERITALCEYKTSQEVMNPEVFIEWCGDYEGGWIEVYYGTQVQPGDIEIYA